MLVMVSAVCAAGTARAGDGADGVVVVGGDAEERDRAAVNNGLIAGIAAAGWRLPDKPLSRKEALGLLRCLEPGEPWACIPGTVAARGIHRALVVAAQKQQADDGSPVVVLSAKLIVTKPRALVVQQRFCEHCTDDRLTQASAQLTDQLVKELAVRMGRTVLEVKSTPMGARITLDGVAIGATDTTFNTYPGPHIVILEKPGYLTQTISVAAEEGKTAEVAAMLQPSPSTSPPRDEPTQPSPRPQRSRIVPIAAIGAGGAGLIGAGVLLYLGAQDGPDDKTLHTRATELGVVTGVASVAAIGVGTYLLWWRDASTSSPTVAPARGGAVVGWMKRF